MTRKLLPAFPLVFALMLACNAVTGASTPDPTGSTGEPIPPPASQVPATAGTATSDVIDTILTGPIQIEGVAYMAYQIPGDPFRFVCQEPCRLDLEYIHAEYAGFRLAHASLIQVTGVDTLAELQPVDMHLDLEDSICQVAPYGHASVYSDLHQAYTCIDGPGYYPTLEEKIAAAALPGQQYFPLHEYMHTMFFGRLSGTTGNFQDYRAAFFHDYVVPIPAYAIGGLDPAGFCSYRDLAPGDYGGWLIHELCQQNGFQLQHLAQSLIALDALYQSGDGQVPQAGYEHPAPSVAQYRDILNALLGSDTTQAFAAACWPPELFGNSYQPAPACVPSTTNATATPVR
jgi:hypothetical protein